MILVAAKVVMQRLQAQHMVLASLDLHIGANVRPHVIVHSLQNSYAYGFTPLKSRFTDVALVYSS